MLIACICLTCKHWTPGPDETRYEEKDGKMWCIMPPEGGKGRCGRPEVDSTRNGWDTCTGWKASWSKGVTYTHTERRKS